MAAAGPGALGDGVKRRIQAKRVKASKARVTHEHLVLGVASVTLCAREAVDTLETIDINVGDRNPKAVRVVALMALHAIDELGILCNG